MSPAPSSVARSPRTRTLARLRDLVVHGPAVGGSLHLAEHADAGFGSLGPSEMCASPKASEGRPAHVVRHDRARVGVCHGCDLQPAVLPHADAPRALVEHDRLPRPPADLVVRALRLVAEHIEGPVVEHVAVLVDLHERGTGMRRRGAERPVRCLRSVSIVRATNVAEAPSARATGLNGRSTDPNGVDFVTLPCSEVGEYWPFVSP